MQSGSIFTTFIILLVEAEEDGTVFKGVTIEKFEWGFYHGKISILYSGKYSSLIPQTAHRIPKNVLCIIGDRRY